ncbi:MAG: ParB/RepB/Spo0J family partition protein [Myxococcota bacterium]
MAAVGKRGLGRGLAALIPDSAFENDAPSPGRRTRLRMVPLDEIRPNPEQPRQVFEADALAALAKSIEQHGILSPLVVRQDRGDYVLIAGERRFRAAGLAGLHEVPCVVRDAPRAREQLELALIENLLREDLDPIEAALGYRRLADDFGLTQEEIAQRVGRNRATVANALRLLQLPEDVLDTVRRGELSAGHARALLSLVDDLRVLRRVMSQCVNEQWSVRELERQVARMVSGPAKKARKSRGSGPTMEYATRQLRDALHTSVAIKPLKTGGGRIVVDYADAEDLERLIQKMRG